MLYYVILIHLIESLIRHTLTGHHLRNYVHCTLTVITSQHYRNILPVKVNERLVCIIRQTITPLRKIG